jgi:hypothetical protein
MPYLTVVILSVAVGAAVYWLTVRANGAEVLAPGFEAPGFEAPAFEPSDLGAAREEVAERVAGAPRPGYAYLEVMVVHRPTWRERVQGLVGTLVLVVVGMVGVAGALYLLGAAINRTIERFLGQ